jgi:hypothetical protein
VGGNFLSGGTDPQRSLAAINLTSGALLPRNAGWSFLDYEVSAMAISANTLFVVSKDGSRRTELAALGLNSKTTLWSQTHNDGAIALLERGNVLYDSLPSKSLRAIRAQTGVELGWTPKLDGQVFSLAAYGDSLYVGGNFQTIDGQSTGSFTLLPRFILPPP